MFVSPMLLHKYEPPFANLPFKEDQYLCELKLDGIRLILSKFNNKISVFTRHNNNVSSKFPELLSLNIPNGTVLDGELVVTDSEGKPDFEEMMSRFQKGKNGEQKIEYCVFDILYNDGKKLTNLPLLERKKILEDTIQPNDSVVIVQWVHGNAEAYFNLTKQHGLEGIVCKSTSSKYYPDTRSHNWLKVINYQFADVYVLGIKKDEFGLLLGLEEGNKIRPVGFMEFMTPAARKQFYGIYRDYVVEEDQKITYLEPQIKMKVKFRNFTKQGNLRIPSFIEYIS